MHRDADGNIIRTIEREAEFSENDVDLLLEWRRRENERGPHGHPIGEATSADADPNNRDGKYRYVADAAPTIDYAEKARLDAFEAYRKLYGDVPHGAFFPVRRIDN